MGVATRFLGDGFMFAGITTFKSPTECAVDYQKTTVKTTDNRNRSQKQASVSGFSPVWVRSCGTTAPFRLKCLEHIEQE